MGTLFRPPDPKQIGLFNAAREILQTFKEQRAHDRLGQYKPYPAQREFHAAGSWARERLLISGNQTGKSFALCAELAIHLTGAYPAWWTGKRFTYPIRTWAGSVTSELLRDSIQAKLLGPRGDRGSGFIPRRCIPFDNIRSARGLPDLVDTLYVNGVHGVSSCNFKSYEKGRQKWQAESVDIIVFDEEPPLAIYTEALARISAARGIILCGLTPLLGMSKVVMRYLQEEAADRHTTRMTIADAEHFSLEERLRVIESYPEHERAARADGIPFMGSGQVYPVAESALRVDPFELPKFWPRIAGIDFGWEHPTAVCWLAHDTENDCVYVTNVYSVSKQIPAIHASAIRKRGDWIPLAWPKDGLSAEKGTGKSVAPLYVDEQVNMLGVHAAFEDGGVSVEAGVMEVLERMKTGRLKVFSTCPEWFTEFRAYHRKEGLIVPLYNDILDAMRYAIMMLRFAEVKLEARPREKRRFNQAPSSLVY
jgi:phage terminase large subunit-like protein